jgi:3-isopropylmalate dehydrogenase
MLLEHLGRVAQARAVESAVAADLAERGTEPRSTSAVGDAIASRLA